MRNQKGLYVPMLCSRPSIKDVNQRRSELRSESFAGDPLSPKLSCIGQLKKRNTSDGFFNQTTINNNVKYLKLKKKLFSGKNLTTAASISFAVQTRRQRVKNEKQGCLSVVDVDMDPPLPVIKKKVKNKDAEEEGLGSLWKRRSGGIELRSLELQQSRHFRPHLHLQATSASV